ncbi:MAG: N-acetylmuramoyl-L-alanine amidase [Firmicutes bacterium]|nr:N-acetylmuramoyl-L-alanine amidase [Bacillota bacterium]MDI6705920.1 N-acetylmuramoyl-L-alanine amidase CwlD [Bacillota bacterium]
MHLLIIRNKYFIAVALCAGIVFTIALNSGIFRESREVFFPITNKVIYIDAGHGGRDPGAVGKSGKNEDQINLDIALKLKRLVENGGGIAILTRDGDYGLYSPDAPNKKREDLENRRSLAEESQSQINVIIHLNSFPQSRYYGAQTFYFKDSEESKKLASIVQEELRMVLDKNNTRQPKPDSDLYLLKTSKVPTVLVECGFLSNAQEERLLNDEIYQEKVAWAIYIGILRYLSTEQG